MTEKQTAAEAQIETTADELLARFEADFRALFGPLEPWPSAKEGARPGPAPRAFPDFSSRGVPDALEIARGMNDVLRALSAKLAENDAPRDA